MGQVENLIDHMQEAAENILHKPWILLNIHSFQARIRTARGYHFEKL